MVQKMVRYEMAKDTFDEAKFYGADDDEYLSCTVPEDYIAEVFDNCWDPEETFEENLRRFCPVQVTGYTPKALDRGEVDHEMGLAVETLLENLSEEYGDPEYDRPFLDSEKTKRLQAKLLAVCWDFLQKEAFIWACDRVGSRSYDIDEVRSMVDDEHLVEAGHGLG